MQAQRQKLLYFECAVDGHKGQYLDKVCVDGRCSTHELVCSWCVESFHKGHEVLPLPQFLEEVDEMRRANQPTVNHIGLELLNSLKASYIEGIAALKELFEGSLLRLQDCLQYYTPAEKALAEQVDRQPLESAYDPHIGLDKTN